MRWSVVLLLLLLLPLDAQQPANPCTAAVIADPASDPATAYACSLFLQQQALDAGYTPADSALEQVITLVLRVTGLPQIIAATSVGRDVDAALTEVMALGGDPFTGELLFNGLVDGLDGVPLGCAACHNGETAPLAAGTWTRAAEIRLLDPALAGYTVERYLIASILRPNDYIPEGYLPNLMPDNYHARLNPQQLADLVAYLSAQDQLIDEVAP